MSSRCSGTVRDRLAPGPLAGVADQLADEVARTVAFQALAGVLHTLCGLFPYADAFAINLKPDAIDVTAFRGVHPLGGFGE